MIQKHQGNLIENVKEGIIVHGCNAKGVMGSGFAKELKEAYPGVYHAYNKSHRASPLQLGDIIAVQGSLPKINVSMHVIEHLDSTLPENLVVVNAITQESYGRDKSVLYVDYDAVLAAFCRVKIIAKNTGLPVHFPLIGCGLANGEWGVVEQLIEAAIGPDIEKHLWVL